VPAVAAGRVRSDRIDQLRGAAALAVVVCHLAVSAYRGAPNLDGGRWPWLALTLGFGYLGVPLFFVISGFCIHLPQARALASTAPMRGPEWRTFFLRRFWRLYPPYLAALGVALAVLWLVQALPVVSWLMLATQGLLVHTFHTATFDGINPPAWTLAVEAQLYLVYPSVFWLISRLGAFPALGVVFGATMGYRVALALTPLPETLSGPAWELFLARWFEWVLGAVVAEWGAGRVALPRAFCTPWLATSVLGLGVFLEWHTWHHRLYVLKEPLYGVAFALLLCVVLAREQPGARSRVGGYLAGVGLYSYSLYLLHRPIQLAFEPLARAVATWPIVVTHQVPSSLLIMAATMPLILWASRLFYRYCEAPAIQRSRSVRHGGRSVGVGSGAKDPLA
jgi:peptidoglycan/LPS O-acetylase OafA/YrhL